MKRLLLLLLLVSCTTTPKVIFDNGVSFNIEVAETPEEKAQGLMNRESMPDNHGMLFIFDDEYERTFWMKNTLISLDMIFLDKDMKVVEINSNVQPCKEDPCEKYVSKPAMYVLEINGGLAETIEVGSVMSRK